MTRKLRHLPLNRPIRTTYQYNNVMFAVAAHLVESLSGQYSADFLRERVWDPLQMNSTCSAGDDLEKQGCMEDMAFGYGYDKEKKGYFEIPWPVQPEGRGAGEMISSALDYAEFLKCMLNKTGPISEKGHEELVKPRIVTDEKPKPFMSHICYALGWEIFNYHGETIVGHDGATNGFTSKMIFIPRLKWGFVSFANAQDGYEAQQKICCSLFYDLLNVPLDKRFDWDEHFQKQREENQPDAKEDLYPELPDPPLPTTLGLSAYAGEYFHPGWGTHGVEVKDGKLQIDCRDRTWKYVLTLTHASGEFFVAELDFTFDTREKFNLRAEFKIGADGTVASMGIEYIEELDGEKIWFERR